MVDMTRVAYDAMQAEKAAAEQERMKARIAKEEAQLQARRDKQAQQLADRVAGKRTLVAAQDSEAILADSARNLAEAEDAAVVAKQRATELRAQVEKLEIRVGVSLAAVKRAQERHGDDVEALCSLKGALSGDVAISTEDQVQNLQQAWEASKKAWEKVSKTVKKKEQNRSLKKHVKSLLGF